MRKQDAPPQSTFAPDPPQLNWTHRPFQIHPTQIGLTAPIRDSPHYRAPPQSTFAPIHIRPRSAPVKLDAPPPSRSAPHKLDLQPQYGIRPTIAWTHRPLPDPPHTNWTYSPNTGFPVVHRMLMLENDRPVYMVDSALPIYGIFSALQSITRTGALNV